MELARVGKKALSDGIDLKKYISLLSKHPAVAKHVNSPPYLANYAARNPSFCRDLGMELYMFDTAKWKMYSVLTKRLTSPWYVAAQRAEAKTRMRGLINTIREEAHLRGFSAAKMTSVAKERGFLLVVKEGRLSILLKTPSMTFALRDVSLKTILAAGVGVGTAVWIEDEMTEEPPPPHLVESPSERAERFRKAAGILSILDAGIKE
ncbi:MAG: hypothetical protein MJE77_22985 [Proteobacteria bacterium]|nr:hypothetical protein [Pseudomonadota bacterium]